MDSAKISSDFIENSIRKFKPTRQHKVYNPYPEDSIYDQAKEHETKTRNLKKALSLYVKAALNGEKINSCIKDFASVLHQCGFTLKAISFLEDMKPIYKGDKQKYDRLIKNLEQQLKPTGKHGYRNILIDLVDIRLQNPQVQILEMFENSSRIRSVECYENLGFTIPNMQGRYILLQFDSFSAAKKTLQSFKEEEWFGVNKFWIDSSLYIVAQAGNGKDDFEKGVVFRKGYIQKVNGQEASEKDLTLTPSKFAHTFEYEGLERKNEASVYLIHNYTEIIKRFMPEAEN